MGTIGYFNRVNANKTVILSGFSSVEYNKRKKLCENTNSPVTGEFVVI